MAVLIAVLAVPYCVNVGMAVNQDRARPEAEQDQSRHAIAAVALADSTIQPGRYATVGSVKVQWVVNATPHTASVRVDDVIKAGDPVQVWTDARGELTRPPTQSSRGATDAVATGSALWLLIVGAAAAFVAAARNVVDRRRRRAWDRALLVLIGNNGGRANRPH